jgi:arginyl-tRNA synthetase
METIASILETRLRAALSGIAEGADGKVQQVNDARFGDYQTNVAMILAKQLRTNPRQLAQQLMERLEVSDCCDAVEIAGAGFINFRLRPEWLAAQVAQLRDDASLGVPYPGQSRTFVVDFSSPNVAKPMHVGHIRSTILGDSLARIATFVGHKVITDNHIGDWGTQFGMLLLGWKTLLNRDALKSDPIGEMERLYKAINAQCDDTKSTFNPEVRGNARQELVKLQQGDEENLGIWREMQRLSQAQFDTIYARLGVTFDVALGESFYNAWLREVVAELAEKGIARESEGAMCVFSDGSLPPKDDPFLIQRDGEWIPQPALVQKEDGAANYTTTDLATLRYRVREWNPDEIIYVTDGRQQLHFRQLFAVFQRWMPEQAAKVRLAHVWFGSILGPDNKPLKTRSGENVKLTELLDEAEERALKIVTEKNPDLTDAERREIARIIGIGAVKYADLSPNRQSDYVFSWDKMLALQGNTAPYLQNAYVRIQSIFRKARENGIDPSERRGAPLHLSEPAEIALAKKLLQFGEIVPQVLDDYRPNILCTYLFELAATFHSFFEACPVLKEEGSIRGSRLTLCEETARILRGGLWLLGIEVPERM